MSNSLSYDSLLVRHLAAELHDRLAGRPARRLFFDSERRVVRLDLVDATLLWELHPSTGRVALLDRAPESAGTEAGSPRGARTSAAAALPGEIRLARGAQVADVSAPPDERVIILRLRGAGAARGRTRRLVIELMTNQWNAVAVDGTDRTVAAMTPRQAAGRRIWPGAVYQPPPPTGRAGAAEPIGQDEWRALLAAVPPGGRRRALVQRVAYTSTRNASAILGAAERPTGDAEPDSDDGDAEPVPRAAADDAELEAAHARYRRIVTAPASPRVLRLERPQPYPVPLPGVPDKPAPSLLAAIARAAGGEPAAAVAPGVPPALLNQLDKRLRQLDKRAGRLREELEGARPEAQAQRRRADLLLSQVHLVRKGMAEVEISDFEGGTLAVELDPALDPVENARRLYDAARKRERAADRLPALLASAVAERDRLAALRSRAESGDADAAEVEAAVGPAHAQRPRAASPMLPYRRYRTSGGSEVRVGRGSRHNDELTFHHSSPDDIWLHARGAAGAHVILRWTDKESNPPARELLEAAVLAALHSRARTSGTVAVDWTRRKHVRKPRKAPPGRVAPDRVSTLFVEPDPGLERRLRAHDPGG